MANFMRCFFLVAYAKQVTAHQKSGNQAKPQQISNNNKVQMSKVSSPIKSPKQKPTTPVVNPANKVTPTATTPTTAPSRPIQKVAPTPGKPTRAPPKTDPQNKSPHGISRAINQSIKQSTPKATTTCNQNKENKNVDIKKEPPTVVPEHQPEVYEELLPSTGPQEVYECLESGQAQDDMDVQPGDEMYLALEEQTLPTVYEALGNH